MPTSAIQRAAQLRLDKTLGSQKPERRFRDATNSDREENTKARRSPQARHTALRLAKTLVTGGRDKQKSFVNQAAGELAARGAQMAGSFIGSYVPIIGTAVGSAVGKRFGRLFGEHWKFMVPITFFFLFVLFYLWINMYTIIFMLLLDL